MLDSVCGAQLDRVMLSRALLVARKLHLTDCVLDEDTCPQVVHHAQKAVVLTLPELLRFGSAQEWRLIIYGFAIVFVILFRPKGLMGDKELSLSAIVNWFERVTKRASEVNMK